MREIYPEARIALCKCNEAHKTYGVRFEKSGNAWKYTWAFEINELAAKREGYDNTLLTGNIELGNDYPGCPYCGATSFVVCSCGGLSCNNSTYLHKKFECDWCGVTGELCGSYDGTGINSGGDM